MNNLAIKLSTIALLLNSWGAIALLSQPLSYQSEKASINHKPIASAKSLKDSDERILTSANTCLSYKIDSICARRPLKSGVVGVFAVNMAGDTLVAHNSDVMFAPASNVKLLSTGLAIRVLGSDYQFETKLAYSGHIEGGCLKGDLYIVGGGDPTTGSRIEYATPLASLFQKWAKLLKDAGIQSIQGNILADPRYFDSDYAENLTWGLDDLGTFFGVAPTGLNFFENKHNFLIKPAENVGQQPSIVEQFPLTPWMQYLNSASTGAARSANSITYLPTSVAPMAQFVGQFPVDRKSYTFEGANRFGALTCAYYFYNHLTDRGFSVKGSYGDITYGDYIRLAKKSVSGQSAANPLSRADVILDISSRKASEDLVEIGSTKSPYLRTIITEANHESNNFFAETLLKAVAKERRGGIEVNDITKAIEAEFQAMGLPRNYKYVDGSGLSRQNFFSPAFFVSFLKAMTKDPEYQYYLRSIPVPGSKSTLQGKFSKEDPSLRSRIYMKSGSMTGVLCYSGYILSEDGDPSKTIVFSVMANNLGSKLKYYYPAVDSIIKLIAEQN